MLDSGVGSEEGKETTLNCTAYMQTEKLNSCLRVGVRKTTLCNLCRELRRRFRKLFSPKSSFSKISLSEWLPHFRHVSEP